MQTIIGSGRFAPSQLMGELTAQVPTFRRVTGGWADADMGQVHSRPNGALIADQVTVVFADDILAIDVQAVIDAHVPTPAQPPRDFK